MATTNLNNSELLFNFHKARTIALNDAGCYPQIVNALSVHLRPSAPLEFRRWGADFLAETLASPSIPLDRKQEMGLEILQLLKELLETPEEDAAVVKSAVQIATSAYPLVFKHIVYKPGDEASWQNMLAIKSNILKRMDGAPAGVKVCCIKFIQKVVLVQTPGLVADPRRPEQNDLSLSLVPRDHPLIPPRKLEAEAFGLLDRLLTVFQDTPSDALLVTATLNSMAVLVRTRHSISNRILNAILSFNPFRVAAMNVTPRMKVIIKSMERTIRAFLVNLNKRNPTHPFAGKVSSYLEHLQQLRAEFLDLGSRKRAAPTEPTDGLDANKRQRLGASVPATPPQATLGPPLPPGPVSVAQLFTLAQDDDHADANFDVQAIPNDLVRRMVPLLLQTIDVASLENALNAVRSRYLSLVESKPVSALAVAQRATGVVEDAFRPTEDAEQILNRLDAAPVEDHAFIQPPEMSLGPFAISQPAPLTIEEATDFGLSAITRIFATVDGLAETNNRTPKNGFNRRAAGNHDNNSYVTLLARMATRSLATLETTADGLKGEGDIERQAIPASLRIPSVIRVGLHMYVLSDFRKRIDSGIAWLNEEWYNDQIQLQSGNGAVLHYDELSLKLFDAIVPYLDAKDKNVLIRFLSEIPSINQDMLERVKRLARDPERVMLAVTAMHYLALMRPPVRTICIDALEDLWRNYGDAKAASAKLLLKWRPHILQEDSKPI